MVDIEPNFEIQREFKSPKTKFQIPPGQKNLLETKRLSKMREAWKEISTRDRAILLARTTIMFEAIRKRRDHRSPPS